MRIKARADWRETASSRRPVDLVHLSRQTLGERGLEREVLALFRTQSLLCLAQLRTARTLSDWREAAHALKGSARAIGAWHVAECAARAEDLDPGRDQAQFRAERIGEIAAALKEARAFIAGLL